MVTILENNRNQILVWRGQKHIFASGSKHIDYLDRTADLTFTDEVEITNIMSKLSPSEVFYLDSGEFIHTENFNEELFNDTDVD